MKQLKCQKCSKIWYVDGTELNNINFCPYCSTPIRRKGAIGTIDTLGKAIYSAISVGGLDILTSGEKISGYLLDLVPELKKEIRIFTKTFDNEYMPLYRNAFVQSDNDIEITMNKLKSAFVEEEGLSDTWANMLCDNCQMAISYYQGRGLPDIYSCQIQDVPTVINNEAQNLHSEFISSPQNSDLPECSIKKEIGRNCKYKAGNKIEFGHDENGNPIHWLILEIKNKLALILYDGKEIKQRFHEKSMYIRYDVIWKDCSLREWLNYDFMLEHFTNKEINLIKQVDVKTADIITRDSVFCLSIADVNKYEHVIDNLDKEQWLLRDKGIGSGNIATYANDEVCLQGKNASCITSIRPAMYISTSYFDI